MKFDIATLVMFIALELTRIAPKQSALADVITLLVYARMYLVFPPSRIPLVVRQERAR